MINFQINSDLSTSFIVFCQFVLHLITDNRLTDGKQTTAVHQSTSKSTQTVHSKCLKLERNFARKTKNCFEYTELSLSICEVVF